MIDSRLGEARRGDIPKRGDDDEHREDVLAHHLTEEGLEEVACDDDAGASEVVFGYDEEEGDVSEHVADRDEGEGDRGRELEGRDRVADLGEDLVGCAVAAEAVQDLEEGSRVVVWLC